MNLRSEHGGGVDEAAGPHHEAQVALLQVDVGGLQHIPVKLLPEPDDVWAEQPS